MSEVAQYRAYFGAYWDVPATERLPLAPTPVGEPCLDCGEPIVEGDRGYIEPCIGLADGLDPEGDWDRKDNTNFTVIWRPIHRECRLLGVVGHTFGYCSCNNYQGLTRRQGAIKTWEAVQHQGT